MAASVLGKRSRRVLVAEDIAVDLPARKRRAQCSTPRIFEDEENLSITTDKVSTRSRRSVTRPNPSPNTRIARSKQILQDTSVTDDSICIVTDTKYAEPLQDENLPPFVASTPTTNRIKDILGLKTPTTPKHRVRLAGSFLTPRVQRTATPSTSRCQSIFASARQLFTQSNNPTKLVGRDTERRQITQFITDAVTTKSGGCTYISGPPGTGKSAMVHDVFQDFESHEDVDVCILNCISLRSSAEVYSKLLQDFAPTSTTSKTNHKQNLARLFLGKSKKRTQLILLDEIDNLLDTDCDVLYTLFEWAMHRSSSLVLIGIANALDLTDRFLPRLKAKGLKPELLPFLPYTGQQISNIISDKLRSLLGMDTTADESFVPFMQPAAIQLCGRKIASQTGDLRKAFGLVRRVIDQLEKETVAKHATSPTKQALGELSNLRCPPTPSSTLSKSNGQSIESMIFTPETAPRASIAHVARISSSIFNNGTSSRLAGLNLQQKAVLCSLVGGEKHKAERDPFVTPSKSASKVPTVKDLFSKYMLLCQRDEGLLHPLKDTEFRDVVASLETLGLVHEYKGRSSTLLTPTSSSSRAGRMDDQKSLVSAVSEREMRESLNGAGADLLRRLLDEA